MTAQDKEMPKHPVSVRLQADGSISIPKELLEAVKWQADGEVLIFE